jgi:hypothetical protein
MSATSLALSLPRLATPDVKQHLQVRPRACSAFCFVLFFRYDPLIFTPPMQWNWQGQRRWETLSETFDTLQDRLKLREPVEPRGRKAPVGVRPDERATLSASTGRSSSRRSPCPTNTGAVLREQVGSTRGASNVSSRSMRVLEAVEMQAETSSDNDSPHDGAAFFEALSQA